MRLIEIEAYDMQVQPVWEAQIEVRDHKPVLWLAGDMVRRMHEAGYLAHGDLISAIGHWVVVFETLVGTGEPAVLYLGNIRFNPKVAGKIGGSCNGPFEVPKRRNYKLPPGWHWAKFNEVWWQDVIDDHPRYDRLMKARELRI